MNATYKKLLMQSIKGLNNLLKDLQGNPSATLDGALRQDFYEFLSAHEDYEASEMYDIIVSMPMFPAKAEVLEILCDWCTNYWCSLVIDDGESPE